MVSALVIDLYQLTMIAGYVALGRHLSTRASFELFVRRLPRNRNFMVAAGVEQALSLLESLRFQDAEVAWLERQPQFASVPASFFEYLRGFRFSGDVWSVREGTPVFANEPLLRVTAPIAEAQAVETALLAIVNFQTSIASKAARVVIAAEGRPVMEFGARRAHGLEAALYAARAACLAGCAGTSVVEAGRRWAVPLSGTMAHSWVTAASDEISAFRDYEALFGEHAVLLLDTYDTVAAARAIVARGLRPPAVRLDSGDLASLSREVRTILDEGGLHETRILASGDLDEHEIARLIAAGASIDGFGVGTSVATSIDAPALGGVYKLVEVEDARGPRLVRKTSTGKATWPGRKQVWRVIDGPRAVRDIVAFADEPAVTGGRPLLEPVMLAGAIVRREPFAEARAWCAERVAELPADLRRIDPASAYEVRPSELLRAALGRPEGGHSQLFRAPA